MGIRVKCRRYLLKILHSRYHNMKKVYIALIPFALIALYCTAAQAKCSRADVEYFLKKGFTRDQVTAICADTSDTQTPDSPRYKAYDAQTDREQREEEERSLEREQRELVKAAISAWDVQLTPRWLGYTHKICVSKSAYDAEARTKICPEVKYRIYFHGLDIKGAERKYFGFGRREIEVEGRIKRKLLHDFKEYPAEARRLLINSYKSRIREKGTFIPIRKDYPLHQIAEILRRYVREAPPPRKRQEPVGK